MKSLLLLVLAFLSTQAQTQHSDKDSTQSAKKLRKQSIKDEAAKIDSSGEISKHSTEDTIIGKDEKGRTIYEGPRGGRYYRSSTGSKVYVKKKK